jgi:capsular exopolysaccharide synthesis family protein
MEQEIKKSYIEEETIDVREILSKLYKRRWIIISFVVICTTISLIYSFMLQPVYRATSRILIETASPKVVNFDNVALGEYRDIHSQCEILKSYTVASLVYKIIGDYIPWDKWKGRENITDKNLTEETKIKSLLSRVDVAQFRETRVININVEDIDPELAKKIANAWINAYISYTMETQTSLARYASGWLEKEIKKAKQAVKEAEENLQRYRRTHNIIIDTSSGDSEDTTALFNQLIRRKAELETELAQQLNYFKEKHPLIIGIKSELSSIEDKIKEEKQRQLSLKEKVIQYNILKREVETAQALYESLLNRLRETESIEGLKVTNIKVIDEARLPKSPIRPRKKLNVFIALFFGLFTGTGIAFLLESIDQSIKTPEDAQKTLNLPSLGIISQVSLKDKKIPPELISVKSSLSPITEAYRCLRTNILFSNPDTRKKTIVVTSACPSEGKTTIATNLAIVFAQLGEKTILVDADFRHPKLHEIFKVPRIEGITEMLVDNRDDYTSNVHPTEVPNLDILVCGAIPPNPSELLGSKRMEKFIDGLCNIYDKVIFDTPPVLAVTDSVILSSKVDATILVIKADYTHKKSILRTKELISSVESKILGVVLNMVRVEKGGGYYYYHYYHYYGYPERKKKAKQPTPV